MLEFPLDMKKDLEAECPEMTQAGWNLTTVSPKCTMGHRKGLTRKGSLFLTNSGCMNAELAQPPTVKPPEQNAQQSRRQHGTFENEVRGAVTTSPADAGAAVPVGIA